jgi:hypothetical protein
MSNNYPRKPEWMPWQDYVKWCDDIDAAVKLEERASEYTSYREKEYSEFQARLTQIQEETLEKYKTSQSDTFQPATSYTSVSSIDRAIADQNTKRMDASTIEERIFAEQNRTKLIEEKKRLELEEEERRRREEEAREKKDMHAQIRCPKCGREMDSGSQGYCSGCQQKEQTTEYSCPRCRRKTDHYSPRGCESCLQEEERHKEAERKRNMHHCRRCRKELDSGSRQDYCGSCQQEKEEEERRRDQRYCPECRGKIYRGECESCGYRL